MHAPAAACSQRSTADRAHAAQHPRGSASGGQRQTGAGFAPVRLVRHGVKYATACRHRASEWPRLSGHQAAPSPGVALHPSVRSRCATLPSAWRPHSACIAERAPFSQPEGVKPARQTHHGAWPCVVLGPCPPSDGTPRWSTDCSSTMAIAASPASPAQTCHAKSTPKAWTRSLGNSDHTQRHAALVNTGTCEAGEWFSSRHGRICKRTITSTHGDASRSRFSMHLRLS